MNSVYLKGGGDIDHIVLGPSGIYVLETKNWSGKIVCKGDQWQRPGKKVKSNPSMQAKYNTQKIKKLLNTQPFFHGLDVWVEGLIIFTNTRASLSISNSTVPILKLQQLPGHIKNQKSSCLTKDQVQQIIKQIKNA
jgi:hypothetical protein